MPRGGRDNEKRSLLRNSKKTGGSSNGDPSAFSPESESGSDSQRGPDTKRSPPENGGASSSSTGHTCRAARTNSARTNSNIIDDEQVTFPHRDKSVSKRNAHSTATATSTDRSVKTRAVNKNTRSRDMTTIENPGIGNTRDGRDITSLNDHIGPRAEDELRQGNTAFSSDESEGGAGISSSSERDESEHSSSDNTNNRDSDSGGESENNESADEIGQRLLPNASPAPMRSPDSNQEMSIRNALLITKKKYTKSIHSLVISYLINCAISILRLLSQYIVLKMLYQNLKVLLRTMYRMMMYRGLVGLCDKPKIPVMARVCYTN